MLSIWCSQQQRKLPKPWVLEGDRMRKWKVLLKLRSAFFSQTNLSFLMGYTVHPVIVSFARGAPCWVYWALKLLKIYVMNRPAQRKRVVKIDTPNSIHLVMMMLHLPIHKVYVDEVFWPFCSSLTSGADATHHSLLRFWSRADSASFLWKDEMSACQKAKVPRMAITKIWRGPKLSEIQVT